MRNKFAVLLLSFICLVPGSGLAGEIESLLCSINSGSPFLLDQITVSGTAARLMPPQEVEADNLVIRREAIIEKQFSFRADYDSDRHEFVRVKTAFAPKAGFPRSDLDGAVKRLLKGQCRSVEVFADSQKSKRNLRIWGTVAFDVEVAFERDSSLPVFYQRSSAFSGPGHRAGHLSRKQILDVFEKRYKKLIPLPADARLDEVLMADYPLSPNELIPVAEIWYRRRDQEGRDYVLFQINPASHELTLYQKKWSDSPDPLHGG